MKTLSNFDVLAVKSKFDPYINQQNIPVDIGAIIVFFAYRANDKNFKSSNGKGRKVKNYIWITIGGDRQFLIHQSQVIKIGEL